VAAVAERTQLVAELDDQIHQPRGIRALDGT
jgi:hypothetical protein